MFERCRHVPIDLDRPRRMRTRGASRKVSAPGPGPISRNRSSGCGSMAATSLSAQAASRKCWPKRLRARGRPALDVIERLASPELFLDLLDFLLAHPEVMSELVNHGFRNAVADLFVVLARLFDGPLIDRDAIGQRVAVAPSAFGQRRALIEAEQRVAAARSPYPPGRAGDGSSSTTTATFFISWRKRRGISRSASSTSSVNLSRVIS